MRRLVDELIPEIQAVLIQWSRVLLASKRSTNLQVQKVKSTCTHQVFFYPCLAYVGTPFHCIFHGIFRLIDEPIVVSDSDPDSDFSW